MIEVQRFVQACAQDVFDVLADGWLYSSWVVGASRVRSVDVGWPAAGTRIHHSVGVWPLLLNDTTRVVVCERPERLTLLARTWPVGEADVELELRDEGPRACVVTMREDVAAGPGRLLPRPLHQAALAPRNAEALRRLAYLAEGRARRPGQGGVEGR